MGRTDWYTDDVDCWGEEGDTSAVIQLIVDWARDGERVKIDGKTVWAGLGNRSGLHSYANTLLREKWEKSGARFQKKIEALPAGTKVELYRFRNINRDRGTWNLMKTVTR